MNGRTELVVEKERVNPSDPLAWAVGNTLRLDHVEPLFSRYAASLLAI